MSLKDASIFGAVMRGIGIGVLVLVMLLFGAMVWSITQFGGTKPAPPSCEELWDRNQATANPVPGDPTGTKLYHDRYIQVCESDHN